MSPDSIGIFVVAEVALRISGPGAVDLVFFYQSCSYLINISFMTPEWIGIFAVAYVALSISGSRASHVAILIRAGSI